MRKTGAGLPRFLPLRSRDLRGRRVPVAPFELQVTPVGDPRRHAPATMRNREPILAVLRRVLPSEGTVLEIAAGSGEHALHFARQLPGLRWRPTDADPEAVASIAAWRIAEGPANLLVPLQLDVLAAEWPVRSADAIFCANMIHIAPWDACLGLLSGSARTLAAASPLVLYGPYHLGGRATAPSNEAFDADLRSRNPEWGVRGLEDVTRAAAEHGFALEETIAMPANNLTVVLRKS